MKIKKQNKYDSFIDALRLVFSKIKNFNLIQEDEASKKVFNFLIKKIAEINAFKTLFTHYYLPAASKSIVDSLNDISKSKYKNQLQITKEELKENYYDTIRLAYIGMFHKYENYMADLIFHIELLYPNSSEISLTKYIKDIFQHDIKDWKHSPTISRINWISNCNKHYDGYPRKSHKPFEFEHLPENEKLKFTKEDFIRDIDSLISHYTTSLTTLLCFASYKDTFENMSFEVNEDTDIEYRKQLMDDKNKMDELMRNQIELGKKF